MDFGSMLSTLATNAGNSQIYGVQQQQREANLEATQTSNAIQQMALLTHQQDFEGRKAVAADMAVMAKDFQQGAKTQQDVLKLATTGAATALTRNQFGLAKEYEDMAKLAEGNLKSQVEVKAREVQASREASSTLAADYLANPTPDTAQQLAQAALRAGVAPQAIPLSNSPQFAAFAKSQLGASKDGERRLEHMDKESDIKDKATARAEEFKQREQDRALQRSSIALQREQNNMFKREQLDRLRANDEERRAKAAAGGPEHLTAQGENTVEGVTAATGEAIRGLRIIGDMSTAEKSSAFAGLHGDGVMSSLTRVGGNVVTPQSSQMYTTATQGLGMEIGRVLTLGGGRGITQAQIDEFQQMIQARPGDTEYTAMFKFANAADILRNRLETLPDSRIKKVRDQQNAYMKELERIPRPGEVWAAAQSDPKSKRLLGELQGPMLRSMDKIMTGAQGAPTMAKSETKRAPASFPTSNLPAGWK